MAYLLLFIYIIAYSNVLQRIKAGRKAFLVFFLPIAIPLILFLGLQNDVGTDYYSYIGMVEGTSSIGYIERKSEWLFVFLVKLARIFNTPQVIFFLAAIIQVFFLALIVYEVKKSNYRLDIFFFLYFTLSLVFFNQFNGIRQYIAVYIVVYAILMLMKSKNKLFVLLIIFAGNFHISAYFFIILLFLNRFIRKKLPLKIIIAIFFGGLFILAFYIGNIQEMIIKLIEFIPSYRHYIKSDYLKALSFEGIITKIPKLFIVAFAVINVNKERTEENDIFLINLSVITCFIMILSFFSSAIWRVYQYVDIFLIFPVMMFMQNKNKKNYSIFISLLLFMMLIVKIIIMPIGEYAYSSILFSNY